MSHSLSKKFLETSAIGKKKYSPREFSSSQQAVLDTRSLHENFMMPRSCMKRIFRAFQTGNILMIFN